MILGSQAKLENDNRSINITRGKRNQCQLGLYPGPVPLGYISETIGGLRKILIDPKRGSLIREVFTKVSDGNPVKEVMEWIDTKTTLRTRDRKLIPKSIIYGMLRNKFYMGNFVMKGIEYQGAYEPIVSPELFEQVQSKLRPFRNTHPRGDRYSIAKFMRCSLCGSPVHRQTKIRKLRSGKTNLHVYYRCSRQKDAHCKAEYVLEEEVFRNITQLIEEVDISRLDLPEQIQDEIIRFERMRWNIFAKMNGGSIKLSIYPLKFKEIDEVTTKMYLQNMILYAKPDKRFFIVSLIINILTSNSTIDLSKPIISLKSQI